MNLLNPTNPREQIDLSNLKSQVELYWSTRESSSYKESLLYVLNFVAPDIIEKVQYDLNTRYLSIDLNTQVGFNSYLRMFFLSQPTDTHPVREFIIDGFFTHWVHYFVNVILFHLVEFYRGIR